MPYLDFADWRGREPVSWPGRHIVAAAAKDEQMITEQAVLDAVVVEELENLRVVVLMDLKSSAGFHAIAFFAAVQ